MGEKMNIPNVVVLGMIASLVLVSVTSASPTAHIVGGDFGWNLPSHPTFYDDWVKSRTFAVGDTLAFHYKPELSTVVEVNKEDYEKCTSLNTLFTYFQGDAVIKLDKPGDYYFFCNVGKHCEAGTKKRYRPKVREESSKKRGVLKIRESRAEKQPTPPRKSLRSKSKLLVVTEESETESDEEASVQKAMETALRVPIPRQPRQKKQRASKAPSHIPGPSFVERSIRDMFQTELQEFERRVYATARDYREVSDRKFEGISKILNLYCQAMIVLEKEVSQRFDHVDKEI
ncbi:early nodulin-55-2-like [Neltuma alba]|uniref:early nodulin-55-2-like n=1 Tax=Neltuma alba TaxID=207710 RepID=UPI0010A458FA|nr:early nodulin-55-2-like [Prosopis alba]